ncbi:RmlC-type cupin [Quillaja saponaria]|uniref:RmlC-type cupin n=1 Tax=Quillaja saponaria TaxID=32244 RepID=A0AAD7Q7Y2_QUISA|nr:RmlC-type cupin [Quillaja saponaria]
MMANPRRSSYSNTASSENPFHIQSSYISSIKQFLKKPHAFPFLLSIFLFLTWVSLRFQHSSQFSAHPLQETHQKWSKEDDMKANLVRFSSGFPSEIAKDKRGWLLDPVSIALDSGISGGAITCASLHLGEIRPGSLRGNHRHYNCNETFVIWGAKTRFRLENAEVADNGYAEVIISEGEVAVATSPSGTAHALVNMDPVQTTYFIGCQDRIINYNSSGSDFNVWKDL